MVLQARTLFPGDGGYQEVALPYMLSRQIKGNHPENGLIAHLGSNFSN